MTLADQLAAEIETIARDAERIQALSRTEPHLFLEQKDAIARRLNAAAAKLRNQFGGAPERFAPGLVAGRRGQVRVEVRRRVAAG